MLYAIACARCLSHSGRPTLLTGTVHSMGGRGSGRLDAQRFRQQTQPSRAEPSHIYPYRLLVLALPSRCSRRCIMARQIVAGVVSDTPSDTHGTNADPGILSTL
jgi:hypothetical protein